MASIVIAGDTSGTVTLSAPAVAGSVVLTLPTASGTPALTSSTLTSGRVPFAGASGVLQDSANLTFNGTGLIAATTIGVGGATPSISGSGITFPATQSASTDANTLDDYEEGSWTPTGNGITLSAASGSYTKIGRMVYASFTATWPTTANTGNARISGLPFNTTDNAGFALQYSDFSTNYFGTLPLSPLSIFDFYSAAGTLLSNASFSTKNVRGIFIYQV